LNARWPRWAHSGPMGPMGSYGPMGPYRAGRPRPAGARPFLNSYGGKPDLNRHCHMMNVQTAYANNTTQIQVSAITHLRTGQICIKTHSAPQGACHDGAPCPSGCVCCHIFEQFANTRGVGRHQPLSYFF